MILRNRKNIASLISIFLISTLLLPVVSHAALITCGIDSAASDNAVGGGCDFVDFISTINRIINWIITSAGVIFTISFIYGGFLWITSGGDTGKIGKAKDVLWSTLKGFVIILVAWLIVYTIIHFLVDPARQSSVLRFLK